MCNRLGFEVNRTYVARKNNRTINQDMRRVAVMCNHDKERMPLGLAIVFMLAAASVCLWFVFLIVYVISGWFIH